MRCPIYHRCHWVMAMVHMFALSHCNSHQFTPPEFLSTYYIGTLFSHSNLTLIKTINFSLSAIRAHCSSASARSYNPSGQFLRLMDPMLWSDASIGYHSRQLFGPTGNLLPAPFFISLKKTLTPLPVILCCTQPRPAIQHALNSGGSSKTYAQSSYSPPSFFTSVIFLYDFSFSNPSLATILNYTPFVLAVNLLIFERYVTLVFPLDLSLSICCSRSLNSFDTAFVSFQSTSTALRTLRIFSFEGLPGTDQTLTPVEYPNYCHLSRELNMINCYLRSSLPFSFNYYS